MVTLIAPRVGEDRYVLFHGFAIGPYDQYMLMEGDAIDLPPAMTMITQSKGFCHENNVEHTKITGDIRYHPFLGGATRVSVGTSYPKHYDAANFPASNWLGGATTFYAENGLASPGHVAYSEYSSNTWEQLAVERSEEAPFKWTVYHLSGLRSGTLPSTLTSVATYTIDSYDHFDYAYLWYTEHVEVHYPPPGGVTSVDWTIRQSLDTIKAIVNSLGISNSYPYYTRIGWLKARVLDETILSPSRIKEHIDAITSQLTSDKFPIEEADYGDLAMKASEKIAANNGNMIAFLKDLSHPTDMIPKISNLSDLVNLRTLTDDYLSVQYGILPTISDVQRIIGAFKRLGPYLDRNGFATYSAGSIAAKTVDEKDYKLEQHVKIAVGNDDSTFVSLLQRAESLGTLPTCKNIWDLIPYSFVVDWLIDVGNFLERADTRLRLMRLDIRYATCSRKSTIAGKLTWDSSHPYAGTINLVQYHRWVTDHCPVPPLSLHKTFQNFDHWLESGALLVQRAK